MDSCQFLSYIIVALIVALVIHLLCKVMNTKGEEGMYDVLSGGSCSAGRIWGPSDKRYDFESNLINVEDKITKPNEVIVVPKVRPEVRPEVKSEKKAEMFEGMDNLYEGMANVDKPHHEVIRGEAGNVNGQGCTVCKTGGSVDDYIRESLLHNAMVCKEKKVLSPEEVNKHRDEYLAFRNGVWQPSNGEDFVDRINDMYLSGSTDISRNHRDVKIKDLYDQLTAGPSLYTNNCVRMADVEDVNRTGNYTVAGSRGKFHTKDNWVYGEEKVMNGGEFMENVFPSEHQGENPMAL